MRAGSVIGVCASLDVVCTAQIIIIVHFTASARLCVCFLPFVCLPLLSSWQASLSCPVAIAGPIYSEFSLGILF
uniref:Putative secreted peptide n=1 Tax=Anopheles braziliensis TaxID=58242 RepID=A0A2M3ZX25_9DIPT